MTPLPPRYVRAVVMGLTLCVFGSSAMAQDDVSGQLWSDYHAHYYQTAKREFYGDTGLRFGGAPDKFFRAYARPSLRYHHTEKLRFLGGLGVFFTRNVDAPNTLEIRPWEGVRYKWPTVGPLTINNLVRFEQRITFASDNNDAAFQLRFRYKLGTSIPLMRVPSKGFFVPVSVEWFWDLGDDVDRFSDDLRLTGGLGYIVDETWIVNFVLTVERSRSSADRDFTTADFIFRFQVKQLLSKKDFRGRIEAPDN